MKIDKFLQRLLNMTEHLSSNRTSTVDEELVSIQEYLDEAFEKRNPSLEIPTGMSVFSLKVDAFVSHLREMIQGVIKEVRLDADRYRLALVKKLTVCQAQIATLDQTLSDLYVQLGEHLSNVTDTHSSRGYTLLYALVSIAIVGAASFTSYLLYKELGRAFAVISSIVFIGGSFLVYKLHQNTRLEKRRRFRFWLYIMGLVFFIGLALSFAIGRGTLLEQLRNFDEGGGNLAANIDIFTQQQKADADADKMIQFIQFVCACAAFVFTIFLEAALGGSYLIEIIERRTFLHRSQDLKFAMSQTRQELQPLREQERILICQSKLLDNFDDFLRSWANGKEAEWMNQLHMQIAQAKNELLAKISNQPNAVLGIVASIVESHATQPNAPKGGFDHVSPQDQDAPIFMDNDGKSKDGDLSNLERFDADNRR